jgi:hypothetical protein
MIQTIVLLFSLNEACYNCKFIVILILLKSHY